jgi:plasmid stability protein
MKAKSKTHILTVREVPDAVYCTLRERAVANRRSLQQEVRRALEQEAQTSPFDLTGFLAWRERFRGRIKGCAVDDLRNLRDR